MPMKGKLLLTAVSIVNWIAGCASFGTERKSVAAVKSGTIVVKGIINVSFVEIGKFVLAQG